MSNQSLTDDILDVLSRYADVQPENFVPAIRQMLVDFANLDRTGSSIETVEGSKIEIAGYTCLILDGSVGISVDTILYIHGGGFVAGSPETHRGLVGQLSRLSKKRVVVIDYPRLPEVSGPQIVDALAAVYDELVASAADDSSIFLAGDSAGGLLALALAKRSMTAGKCPPAGVATFSAVTDMTMSGASFETNAGKDIMLSKKMLGALYAMYLAGAAPDSPEISPLHGDLTRFPPLLMQVGGNEILKDDSVRFVDAVNAAGGFAQIEVWPDLFHVWHNFPSRLPEAVLALGNVAKFFQRLKAGRRLPRS